MTVNAQGNKRVDYTYNAISQVITKYRYSGNNLVAETNHIYDQSDRLTNITHSNGTGANIIASYSQTYDQGDRITGVTSNDGSSSYTYDNTNQLISGEYDFQDNESYSYDSNGNRTNDGYVTGVNNQLLEDNKYLYEYDLVGNRTKRTDKSTNEVMEYRWDIRDRLTGITVKNDLGEIIRTAEYTYDVYNQRIAKTVDTDGDGSLAAVTERFVYGRDQNIALVLDENGNVNHRYLFGNDVDQIEADESNGNVLWALTDHLGSVRDVVDDSGTVLNHIVYDAFGGVTSQTDESVVFRYGYTARELDAESGLQYNRARYLDSFTGKFISEDPIGFQAGDSNLYRYVNNLPITKVDPSGKYGTLKSFSRGGDYIEATIGWTDKQPPNGKKDPRGGVVRSSGLKQFGVSLSQNPEDRGHLVPALLGGSEFNMMADPKDNFISQNVNMNRGAYNTFGQKVNERFEEYYNSYKEECNERSTFRRDNRLSYRGISCGCEFPLPKNPNEPTLTYRVRLIMPPPPTQTIFNNSLSSILSIPSIPESTKYLESEFPQRPERFIASVTFNLNSSLAFTVAYKAFPDYATTTVEFTNYIVFKGDNPYNYKERDNYYTVVQNDGKIKGF
ncbi:MAG: RHS repeat-associated core domain-containing protein [Pseudanabaena sp. M151S2SP2A07QC]|nr:RHS repeat-associated core domain-containing protein [Pseudanabaena sp. M151S2SP2A07QC]